MARWLEELKIRRHVCLYKAFLDAAYALIFIAVCMNVQKLHAQEAGFLSIDCGNTQANYTDSNGLKWVADDGQYIKTGNSSEQVFQDSTMDRALRSFRYFPEYRKKYCYELPTLNISYLFRASFYLNESLLHIQKPFRFIVSIDASNWFSIESGDNSDEDLSIVQEGIFYPPGNVTNFCLQPVYGVPFISSLELRTVPDNGSLYAYSGSYFQYLALTIRYNVGADSASPVVRYPDDSFDRIWKIPDASWNNSLPNVSSPEPPDNTSGENVEVFYVPPKVMQDAWLFESNASYAIFPAFANGSQFSLITPGLYAYVIVYSEYLNSSTSSPYYLELTLDLGNKLEGIYGYYNFSRQAIAVAYPYFYPGSDTINVSLSLYNLTGYPVSIPRGPTMNAVEIYTECNYDFTLTNAEDDDVITDLKTGFSLTDWQGDPCVPVPYDWLSCIEIQSQHALSTFNAMSYVTSM